jgi:hypothetical protein
MLRSRKIPKVGLFLQTRQVINQIMKPTSKKKIQTFQKDPLKRNETLVITKLRVERFRSLLKIFDFLHSLLQSDNIPSFFDSKDDFQKSQTNLYVLTISFLFSLFDRKGTNILNLTSIVKRNNTKELLNQISNDWRTFEPQITRIRHNLGFHGGGLSQLDNGFRAVEQISQKDLALLVQLMKNIELLDDALKQEME